MKAHIRYDLSRAEEPVTGRKAGNGPCQRMDRADSLGKLGTLLVLSVWALSCSAPSPKGPILADNAVDLQNGQLAASDRKVDTALLRALLDDSAVPDLKHLRLASNTLDAAAGTLLAGHARTRRLLDLDVSFNPAFGSSGLRALSGAAMLATLQELRISGTGVDGAAVAALGNAPALRLFDASYAPVTDEACAAIATWPMLERLYLRDTRVTGGGVVKLLAHPAIVLIDLEGAPLSSLAGLGAVSASLKVLGLESTGLGAADASLLATSALHLETLFLSRNRLGDDGVDALVGAPWLTKLKALELRDVGATPAALNRLRAAWGTRGGLTL